MVYGKAEDSRLNSIRLEPCVSWRVKLKVAQFSVRLPSVNSSPLTFTVIWLISESDLTRRRSSISDGRIVRGLSAITSSTLCSENHVTVMGLSGEIKNFFMKTRYDS